MQHSKNNAKSTKNIKYKNLTTCKPGFHSNQVWPISHNSRVVCYRKTSLTPLSWTWTNIFKSVQSYGIVFFLIPRANLYPLHQNGNVGRYAVRFCGLLLVHHHSLWYHFDETNKGRWWDYGWIAAATSIKFTQTGGLIITYQFLHRQSL